MQLFLGVLLLMAEQVGVQSGARIGIHNHSNISQGGLINTIGRVSSATLKINNPTLRSTGLPAFTRLKQVRINEDSPGTMRIDYDLECTVVAGGNSVHGQSRIYRGATLLWSGVDNTELAGPTTYSDVGIAIDLLAGDMVEVWGYRVAGTVCEISNMVVRYTGSFLSLLQRVLTTALPITGADVDYTIIT